jgi:opacity protein-like surface antigen
MVRKSGVGFLLGLVFVLSTCSFAFSNPLNLNFKKDKVYGSINVGLTFLNDLDYDLAGQTQHGFTGTGTGTGSFDTAVSYGGAIGYVISDFIRAELELGYQKIDYDKVEVTTGGTITNSAGAAVTYTTGNYSVSGEIDALTVSTNVILTPFGPVTLNGLPFLELLPLDQVTPLIGGGIGFVDWESKINTIDTQAITGKEEDTDLLVSIMAGLEYTSSQQVTWAIKYRHSWTDTGKNGVEDAEADNVSASLAWLF